MAVKRRLGNIYEPILLRILDKVRPYRKDKRRELDGGRDYDRSSDQYDVVKSIKTWRVAQARNT
jgi:hypothetical protein